jgi:hypothetical protein
VRILRKLLKVRNLKSQKSQFSQKSQVIVTLATRLKILYKGHWRARQMGKTILACYLLGNYPVTTRYLRDNFREWYRERQVHDIKQAPIWAQTILKELWYQHEKMLENNNRRPIC